MKVTIEFNDAQTKLLNKICMDGNYSKFLSDFMEKELFSAFHGNAIHTPQHIHYYEEVERLINLVEIKQQVIADFLGFSQAAISKAFIAQNDRSVIYRSMTQRGSPDQFVGSIYMSIQDNDKVMLDSIGEYLGSISDAEEAASNTTFFSLLNGYVQRKNKTQQNKIDFLEALKKMDVKLLLEISESSLNEQSFEQLYRTLQNCYMLLR